jgi:hypothetical protein
MRGETLVNKEEALTSAGTPEKPTMRDVFGPGGFLEKCMYSGYEYRPAQLEMAEMVHDAFETHHHVIVEAGTGTGKTLAYLLPAISSGRRNRCKSSFTKRTCRFCRSTLRRISRLR